MRLHALIALLGLASTLTGPASDGSTFTATWSSLSNYECPDWFRDAKFGIYAHWGVYSAAEGTGNTDWYSRQMYQPGHPNRAEHEKRFGPVLKVGYKDIVASFTGENFNADEWADLYVKAGARFAGPVGEHADGFSMWASKVNPWNAGAMGPERDIVGELERAVRRRGLRFMVSLHHQWLWGWYPTWDECTDTADPAHASLYGERCPPGAAGLPRADGSLDFMRVDPLPSPRFEAMWLAKVYEVVDGYSPDLLWFDNRMQLLTANSRTDMVAYFYNHAARRNQDVVLTFKRPDLPIGTATSDLERARMPDIYPEPWLTDTSIAKSSWAHATDLEYYSTDRIVDDLVDIVSKNGCMLLNIAPDADGTIPDEQKERLLEVGEWLALNGEAIYGSRPWLVYGEGPTVTPVGHMADLEFEGFGPADIRFTTRGEQLYAIALGWPDTGELNIRSLGTTSHNVEVHGVRLVGHEEQLEWESTPNGLKVGLPDEPPGQHAHVLNIQLNEH